MRAEELPSSEALLRELLSLAPVAILTLDRAGTITSVAGQAVRFPPEQILGQPMVLLAETDDHRAMVAQSLRGEPVDRVASWGGAHWVARFRPSHDPDGNVSGVVAVFVDVTEQVHAQQALAGREQFLSAVIGAAHEALVVVDLAGRLQMANERFGELFGRPVDPGTSLLELLPGSAGLQLQQQLMARAQGQQGRYELRIQTAQGREVWVLVSSSPLRDADGAVTGSVAVLTDITANKDAEQRLRMVSLTDPLTGLGNRTVLTDRLKHALERREAGTLAVLFCDLDGLKDINDRYGHAAGDAVLRHAATRITQAVRPEDTVTRFGGDEFVVLCETLHNPREASVLAERIRTALRTSSEDVPEPVTVSIGVATSPAYPDATQLLAAADAAVYAAKRAGRDQVWHDL